MFIDFQADFSSYFFFFFWSSVSTLAYFYTLESDRGKRTRKRSKQVMMKEKLHNNSFSLYDFIDIYYSRNSKSLDTLRDAHSGNRLCSSLDTKRLHKI